MALVIAEHRQREPGGDVERLTFTGGGLATFQPTNAQNLILCVASPSATGAGFYNDDRGLEGFKGGAGAIVLTSVGSEAVLTALARPEAKLGLIFLEMRRAAEDILKLVG